MKKVLILMISLLTLSIIGCDIKTEPSSSLDSSVSSTKPSSSSSITSISKTNTNFIKNGDFSNDNLYWNKYEGGGRADLSIVNNALKIDVRTGQGIYEPRLDYMNIPFVKNKTYMVEFKAKTDGIDHIIQVQSGELLSYSPWFENFGLAEWYFVTNKWQTYQGFFKHTRDNNKGGLIFEIGQRSGLNYTLLLDDITIYEVSGDGIPNYNLRSVVGEKVITNVPTLSINTDYGREVPYDKNTLVNSKFSLKDNENPFLNVNDLSLKIKARGNSSLYMPKRSYKLEFDTPVDFYSMGANRDWVLTANYADKSLIRNYLAYTLGQKLTNLEFSPKCMFVNLNFNGSYEGLYLLSGNVKTGKSRVNIETNYTDEDSDVPFLLEWDMRLTNPNENNGAREGTNYFKIDWIPFGLEYPKTLNDVSSRQKQYIINYMDNVHRSIMNQNNYSQFIDVDSFIDYFIVQELFKNVDMGFASVFMYKEKGGKLKLGPLWDFDLALGNADYIDYTPYNWYSSESSGNIWFHRLMQSNSFRIKFTNRFNEIKNTVLDELVNSVDIIGRDLISYASTNFTRWKILGIYDWPNPPKVVEADTYDKQVYYVKNYLIERIDWMDHVLNK